MHPSRRITPDPARWFPFIGEAVEARYSPSGLTVAAEVFDLIMGGGATIVLTRPVRIGSAPFEVAAVQGRTAWRGAMEIVPVRALVALGSR